MDFIDGENDELKLNVVGKILSFKNTQLTVSVSTPVLKWNHHNSNIFFKNPLSMFTDTLPFVNEFTFAFPILLYILYL